MLEAEIARLRPLEAEVAKLRQEARQSKSASRSSNSKDRSQQSETNIVNAAASKGSSDTPPRPPVFVSFKNGLFVETEDKAYSFKVGGRIIVDGGGIALPLNGFDNQVGGRQLRLEVEGKAAKIYFYKLQYDFTGTSQITGVNHVLRRHSRRLLWHPKPAVHAAFRQGSGLRHGRQHVRALQRRGDQFLKISRLHRTLACGRHLPAGSSYRPCTGRLWRRLDFQGRHIQHQLRRREPEPRAWLSGDLGHSATLHTQRGRRRSFPV